MHGADTYGIIAIIDIDKVDFTQVPEENNKNLRKSLDGSKFVIKWTKEPSFIADGTIVPLLILSHSECLTLMSTPEWSEPEPVE